MHKRDSAPQARCFVLGSASILPVTGLIAGDAEYCAEMAKCVGTAYALALLPFPPPHRSGVTMTTTCWRTARSSAASSIWTRLRRRAAPWMWASGHGGHVERAAHGYAATREEAMAAFAKSWRRE